jgi:uncharacterized protein (TIGR02217 family)
MPAVFPTLNGIGWPVHRRAHFRTVISKHKSGADMRSQLWPFPLWEFELVFDGLTASRSEFPGLGSQTMQTLMAFYLNLSGQWGTFLWNDPDFNSAQAAPIGYGDGVTTVFPFARVVTFLVREPASWVTGATAVYLNGVSSGGWSISQPNSLVFTTAPGAGVAITADFTYQFLCRFLEDSNDWKQFMINLWEMKSLKFRQVRSGLDYVSPY